MLVILFTAICFLGHTACWNIWLFNHLTDCERTWRARLYIYINIYTLGDFPYKGLCLPWQQVKHVTGLCSRVIIANCFLACCRHIIGSIFALSNFSFGHCVVCSSSIYGFWLPLWYLLTLHKSFGFIHLKTLRVPNVG